MLKPVIRRLSCSVVLVSFFQTLAICQDEGPKFYEVIKGDSLMLFFNHNFQFTEKWCAEYTRFGRANERGDFKGKFVDVSNSNDLLGTGTYDGGRKHGYFEIFYPSGKVKCKGMYLNDSPVGQWKFFYENGLPERTIEFVGDDVVLLQSVDKNGKLNVVNGKGVFKGIVMGPDGKVNLMAKGRIVDGRPTGKWISWYPGQGWRYRFSNEIYKDGKFVKGNFLRSFEYRQVNSIPFGGRGDTIARKAMREMKESFRTYRQCLNNYFLDNYLGELERIRFSKCDSSFHQGGPNLFQGIRVYRRDLTNRVEGGMASEPRYKARNRNYYLSVQSFRRELTDLVGPALANDPRYRAKGYDEGSVVYLTLKFSVNAGGLPENFEGRNFLGNEFDSSIASAISGLTIFNPEKELYFRMKIMFSSATKYHFSYRFTKDKLKSW